ncbi:putative thiol methyltransferase [Paramyrothecium foliicola]|nr:putative thiol methyltransferase [Paramyrothecium foliicola]
MNVSSGINTRAASSASSSLQQSPINSMPSLPRPPAPLPAKTSSTDPFLKDFTLLAEAAKRAQVAVMVRDFEALLVPPTIIGKYEEAIISLSSHPHCRPPLEDKPQEEICGGSRFIYTHAAALLAASRPLGSAKDRGE